MRILIKGYYGFGNLGDDILLKVSYGLLKERFPEAEFYVFANFTENLEGYAQAPGYNQYIHTLLDGPVTLIDWTYKGHFDLVFNGGGGIYFDYQEGNYFRQVFNAGLKAIGVHGVNKLDRVLRSLMNKPPHLTFDKRIGAGLGIDYFAPSAPSFFEKFSELGSYDALWMRDAYSVEALKTYRFKRKYSQATDLAFLTEYWNNLPARHPKPKPDTIGILLLDWHRGLEQLFSTTKAFVERVRSKGYTVKFFSFDESHDKRYLESFTFENVQIWRPNTILLSDYLTEFAACDIVITGRAHGAILGACLGVIPVCLGISKKLKEVSALFGETNCLLTDFQSAPNWLAALETLELHWTEKQHALHVELNRNNAVAELMKNEVVNHLLHAG
jgi:polysaccharide pyruvyl transferase WcaK-like protein